MGEWRTMDVEMSPDRIATVPLQRAPGSSKDLKAKMYFGDCETVKRTILLNVNYLREGETTVSQSLSPKIE